MILGGDICTAKNGMQFRPFFERCAAAFPTVVWIAGNHEFYRSDIEDHDDLRAIVDGIANVHYLNNECIDHCGYRIFGATLWTDCNRGDMATRQTLANAMNDYRVISYKAKAHWRLRPTDTEALFYETLRTALPVWCNSPLPMIFVGHHSPSKLSTHPRYASDTLINGGYSSDLDEWIADVPHGARPIALWTHGHTHHSFDYRINKTRIVCNPRGYYRHGFGNENAEFNPLKVIELP